MQQLIDIYVLKNTRSTKDAILFLEKFTPQCVESAEDYPFPEYSDRPSVVFNNYKDLLDNLSHNKRESYSIYFKNIGLDCTVKNSMLFYTCDGYLIFGLTVHTNNYSYWLDKLFDNVGGIAGYVDFETPPPTDYSKFIEICKTADFSRIEPIG